MERARASVERRTPVTGFDESDCRPHRARRDVTNDESRDKSKSLTAATCEEAISGSAKIVHGRRERSGPIQNVHAWTAFE